MKKLAQPTRSFFTLKISWKTSPGWLQLVFHFGTENRADQLKKPPCIIMVKWAPLNFWRIFRPAIGDCPDNILCESGKSCLNIFEYPCLHLFLNKTIRRPNWGCWSAPWTLAGFSCGSLCFCYYWCTYVSPRKFDIVNALLHKSRLSRYFNKLSPVISKCST